MIIRGRTNKILLYRRFCPYVGKNKAQNYLDCFFIKLPVKILNENSQNMFCSIYPNLYRKKKNFLEGFLILRNFRGFLILLLLSFLSLEDHIENPVVLTTFRSIP